MKAHYDPDSDALFVRLIEAPIQESEEIRPGIIFDFDKDGRIVGFEILDARETLPRGTDLLKEFGVAA